MTSSPIEYSGAWCMKSPQFSKRRGGTRRSMCLKPSPILRGHCPSRRAAASMAQQFQLCRGHNVSALVEVSEQAFRKLVFDGLHRWFAGQVGHPRGVAAQVIELVRAGRIEAVLVLGCANGSNAEPQAVVPFVAVERLIRTAPAGVAALNQRQQRAAVYVGRVGLPAGPLGNGGVEIDR